MTTTWIPVADALQTLAARFRDLGGQADPAWAGPDAGHSWRLMQAAERADRETCDEIMRALLDNSLGTSQPTPRHCYFCSMRCLCALDTLTILQTRLGERELYPDPPEGFSPNELLEWLLVINWQQRCDSWLKLCAFAAATGQAFYSN